MTRAGATPWNRTVAVRTHTSSQGWNQVPVGVEGAISAEKMIAETTTPIVVVTRAPSSQAPRWRVAVSTTATKPANTPDRTVK